MRDLGERNDIIKAINRALADRGEERATGSFVLRGEEAQTPIIGHVIDKRLTDELGDRIGLIIDAVDGRVHHVAFRDAAATEGAKVGAIVEVSRTRSQRPADRNIAIVAAGTGVYRPSDHRKMLEAASARVRGGDYEAFVDTHVRRLEALRRAGIVERASADCWLIPEDFEVRARAYDAGRARTLAGRVDVGVLRMLSDIGQARAGLLRFGGSPMSRMHAPHRAGHAGRIRDIAVQIPIIPAPNRHPAVIGHQGAAALDFGHGRERLLEQRVNRYIKDCLGLRLRSFKIELASGEVLELQSGTPDPATINNRSRLKANRAINPFPLSIAAAWS
jgi:hypothetical protein